jgi:hypothetical protein
MQRHELYESVIGDKRASLLLAILGLILAGWIVFAYAEGHAAKQNFLFKGSVDLRHHIISEGVPPGERAVLMLGSSTVSGNNIPPATTISDYYNRIVIGQRSYDLGLMEANIVDSLILLHLAQKKVRPAVVIYGMNPSNFRSLPGGPLIWSHPDEVRSLLPPEIAAIIERDRAVKQDFSLPLNRLFGKPPPLSAQTHIFTWQWELRLAVYGPLYDKAIDSLGLRDATVREVLQSGQPMMDLLGTMKRLAAKTDSPFVAYFEPMQMPSDGNGPFAEYKKALRDALARAGVPALDYSHLLPENPNYFVDYLHLTPRGNQRVAQELATTLKDIVR